MTAVHCTGADLLGPLVHSRMPFCVCASAPRVCDDTPLPIAGKTHDAYPSASKVRHEHDISFLSRCPAVLTAPPGPATSHLLDRRPVRRWSAISSVRRGGRKRRWTPTATASCWWCWTCFRTRTCRSEPLQAAALRAAAYLAPAARLGRPTGSRPCCLCHGSIHGIVSITQDGHQGTCADLLSACPLQVRQRDTLLQTCCVCLRGLGTVTEASAVLLPSGDGHGAGDRESRAEDAEEGRPAGDRPRGRLHRRAAHEW